MVQSKSSAVGCTCIVTEVSSFGERRHCFLLELANLLPANLLQHCPVPPTVRDFKEARTTIPAGNHGIVLVSYPLIDKSMTLDTKKLGSDNQYPD
jgi:hypothetical protein